VQARIDDLADTIEAWRALDRTTGEARLYALAQFMADVYAAALLLEHAGWEEAELGTDRTALVARLYVRQHLADLGPRRGIDDPAEELTRFKDLVDGAFSSSSSDA
ncbi:MAG: DNA alkylation response protein, partial [Ilumatobacteraceae bacterium]